MSTRNGVSDDGILQREGQLCSECRVCGCLPESCLTNSLPDQQTTGTTPCTQFRSFQSQCSQPHLSSLSPARCSGHFADTYQPPVWMGVREEVSRFYPVRGSASSLVGVAWCPSVSQGLLVQVLLRSLGTGRGECPGPPAWLTPACGVGLAQGGYKPVFSKGQSSALKICSGDLFLFFFITSQKHVLVNSCLIRLNLTVFGGTALCGRAGCSGSLRKLELQAACLGTCSRSRPSMGVC